MTETFCEMDKEHDNSICLHCFPLLQPISFIFPGANKDSQTYLIAIEEKRNNHRAKTKGHQPEGTKAAKITGLSVQDTFN